MQDNQCALAQVQRALRARTLLPPDFAPLLAQQEVLNQSISLLLQSQKTLAAAVVVRKKALTSAKKEFKEVRKKKKKIDTPILSHLENILRKRNICAVAYHGGKLNGVDCRELMTVANELFESEIKPYLLSIPQDNRCTDEKIINACNIHRDICATLDALTSIIRMKNGAVKAHHYMEAEKHL